MTKQELKDRIDIFKFMCYGNLTTRNGGIYNQAEYEAEIAKEKDKLMQAIEAHTADIEREAELEELNQISDIVGAVVDDAVKLYMLRDYVSERKKQLRKWGKF